MSKYEISALEIEGAIGRQFQTLSIVFVCAVNTKLASLFGYTVYGAHWARIKKWRQDS
jgi:hypothetical protein